MMKQTTKRVLGIATLTALAIVMTTGVFAKPGFGPCGAGQRGMMGGPGGMQGMGSGPGWMSKEDQIANTKQRLSDLKNNLGITAEQEAAWNAYEQAVEGKIELMQTHRQAMINNGPVTPEQRQAFHQEGFNQMTKIRDARRGLLQVLTPEQQSKTGNLIGLNCWR